MLTAKVTWRIWGEEQGVEAGITEGSNKEDSSLGGNLEIPDIPSLFKFCTEMESEKVSFAKWTNFTTEEVVGGEDHMEEVYLAIWEMDSKMSIVLDSIGEDNVGMMEHLQNWGRR